MDTQVYDADAAMANFIASEPAVNKSISNESLYVVPGKALPGLQTGSGPALPKAGQIVGQDAKPAPDQPLPQPEEAKAAPEPAVQQLISPQPEEAKPDPEPVVLPQPRPHPEGPEEAKPVPEPVVQQLIRPEPEEAKPAPEPVVQQLFRPQPEEAKSMPPKAVLEEAPQALPHSITSQALVQPQPCEPKSLDGTMPIPAPEDTLKAQPEDATAAAAAPPQGSSAPFSVLSFQAQVCLLQVVI